MKKLLLLFILTALNITGYAQEVNTAKLDSLFDILEKNNKTMGSFAIAKNGKVVYKRSIGFSNINEGKPVPANDKTKYRIGSTTKMYTAAMIYQLVDEGKLTLDTKLEKYYPQMPNAKDITISMLLNHKNGLYDFVNDGDLEWITKPHSKEELLEKISANEPHFAPGENEAYSNSGYLLAAYIIEDVTGKSYNDNLQKRICKKLGLKNTYSPADNVLKDNEANSFHFLEKWDEATDIYFPNVVGVGDILSTPLDVITFNEALVAGKLFSAKSLEAIKKWGCGQFGAGIIKIPFDDKISYGHGGNTYGTHTVASTFPEDKLTIAFSVNGQVYPYNDIAIAMLNIAFDKEYQLPEFKVIEVSTDVLDQYIGIYSSPELPLKLTVTRQENILMAQGTGQPSFPLEATAANKFKFDQAGVVIEFYAEKNQLVLKQGGGVFTMARE